MKNIYCYVAQGVRVDEKRYLQSYGLPRGGAEKTKIGSGKTS